MDPVYESLCCKLYLKINFLLNIFIYNSGGSKLDALLQVGWYTYFKKIEKKKYEEKSEPVLELDLVF